MIEKKKTWKRFLCLLGWHEFKWNYKKGTVVARTPPPHAVCSICGIKYDPFTGGMA